MVSASAVALVTEGEVIEISYHTKLGPEPCAHYEGEAELWLWDNEKQTLGKYLTGYDEDFYFLGIVADSSSKAILMRDEKRHLHALAAPGYPLLEGIANGQIWPHSDFEGSEGRSGDPCADGP